MTTAVSSRYIEPAFRKHEAATGLAVRYSKTMDRSIKGILDLVLCFHISLQGRQDVKKLLIGACHKGDHKLVNYLIHNSSHSFANIQDEEGNSLLMIACTKTHTAVVKLLLRYWAADPNRPNKKGETPLHIAAGGSNVTIVQELLEAGADRSAFDNDGFGPLFRAFKSGSVDVVHAMLKANPTDQVLYLVRPNYDRTEGSSVLSPGNFVLNK